MGSVRKRTRAGGAAAWFIDYINAVGERVREVIGPGEECKQRAQLILKQREAEAVLGKHGVRPLQTPRFAEFAEDWLRLKSARVNGRTLELYEDMLVHRLQPHFGEMRLGAIARRHVEEYLAMQHEQGTQHRPHSQRSQPARVSARTINISLMVVKQILKDAVEQGTLAQNPAAHVKPLRDPNEDGNRIHMLQPEEIARLLDATEEPYRTLYLVAVQTGLRRGELLGLRWGDVDFEQRRLYVQRSLGRIRDGDGYAVRELPLKTRYSRRTIDDLSETVVQALLALPAGDDPKHDYVFRSRVGSPLDPDSLDRAYRRHLAVARLPEIRFHDLRHTHASLLIAAGVHPKAIQARLGHASITTTLNTYGHLMPSAFQGVGARLDAVLQGTAKAPTAKPENPASEHHAKSLERRGV